MSEQSVTTNLLTPIGNDAFTLREFTTARLDKDLQATFQDAVSIDATALQGKSQDQIKEMDTGDMVKMGNISLDIAAKREAVIIKHCVTSFTKKGNPQPITDPEEIMNAVLDLRPSDYEFVLGKCNELSEASKIEDKAKK